MEVDSRLNLLRIRGAVRQRRVDLGTRDRPVGNQFFGCVLDWADADPHHDLPHVRPADHSGPTARRTIAEGDHRVFVASRAFLGVAPKPVRQGLPRRASAKAKSLGKAVIKSYRHIHRHVDIVIRCHHLRIALCLGCSQPQRRHRVSVAPPGAIAPAVEPREVAGEAVNAAH